MKKCLSLILAVMVLLSVCFVMPAGAEEAVDYVNKICTIETPDGKFLNITGADRGNALTVAEEAKEWRFKGFLGGKYSFINDEGFAADVNGASVNEGVTIIQWTATGANNQRWMLEEAEDGYYYILSVFSNLYLTEAEGVITQEAKGDEKNQLWKLNVVGEYEPQVETMLMSDAAKSLDSYRYDRLYDFIMSGGEFNMLTYDKVENMIKERDYFNLSMEEQVAFVEECFTVVPTDLMYGSMATKLKREISVEYVGIEEGAWQSWHGIPEEAPRRYDVTITDTETGDSHVMQYISPYDNDEEYAATVGEAVGCFEMPVVKSLWRFVYTSMNTSSWNGGDGTIWNNTGYRGDVNNMVQMFAHELGHVMDNGRQDTNVWYRAIAQDIVPVTGYGNTNRWEDLAEFSRLYLLAKGDEERIAAIENTYPARTKAYKGLLYAVDNEFYADYKDEYEETLYATGDYNKNEMVTIGLDGKVLTDNGGVLTLMEKRDVIADWQAWEIYTRNAGASIVRNKATGKYLTFTDNMLSLGDATDIGFKTSNEGYEIIQGSTGFVIDESFMVTVDNGAVWSLENAGEIPYNGDYVLKLSATGEELKYVEGEGVVLSEEGNVWTFVPVDRGYYMIMDKATGRVFDISGNSTLEGASAILYSVTGGTNQHFVIENNGDGTYALVLRHSLLKLTSTDEGLCQSAGGMGYTKWVLEKIK